ncbi:unnamed protein product [Spodoptera exigua]|nr:unnamed protein product [Spodoptera exigua]
MSATLPALRVDLATSRLTTFTQKLRALGHHGFDIEQENDGLVKQFVHTNPKWNIVTCSIRTTTDVHIAHSIFYARYREKSQRGPFGWTLSNARIAESDVQHRTLRIKDLSREFVHVRVRTAQIRCLFPAGLSFWDVFI